MRAAAAVSLREAGERGGRGAETDPRNFGPTNHFAHHLFCALLGPFHCASCVWGWLVGWLWLAGWLRVQTNFRGFRNSPNQCRRTLGQWAGMRMIWLDSVSLKFNAEEKESICRRRWHAECLLQSEEAVDRHANRKQDSPEEAITNNPIEMTFCNSQVCMK